MSSVSLVAREYPKVKVCALQSYKHVLVEEKALDGSSSSRRLRRRRRRRAGWTFGGFGGGCSAAGCGDRAVLVVQSLGLLQPLRVQPSQCQPTNLEVRLESSRPRRPRAPPWPPSSPASPARQVSRWGASRKFLRQPPSHHHYRFRHAAHSHRLHYAQLTESLQREY